MLLLGFTRPVASIFTGWDNDANDVMTISLAVVAIYLIDFSINAVMAVDRALLVDTLPPSAQPAGNAWAACMIGVGSVIGFFAGNINLPNILPFLGTTQLEVLSVIVSLLLFSGHALTASSVKERILLKDDNSKARRKTFVQEMKDMWSAMVTLPPVIRKICIIQFFAWLAWFPILFYTTIYVGDIHKGAIFTSPNPPSSEQDRAGLDAEATRLGSRALFYSSLVSLLCNIALPHFASKVRESGRRTEQNGNGLLSSAISGQHCTERNQTRWQTLVKKVVSFQVPRRLQFHLASLWAFSHLVVAACMFATFLTSSVFGATFLVTVTGFSWAVSMWAPLSLLGEAILTEPAPTDVGSTIHLLDTRTRAVEDGERESFLPKSGDSSEDEDDEDKNERRHNQVLTSSTARVSCIDISSSIEGADGLGEPNEGDRGGGLSSKAGVILGIHNIFVVIPQFLVTGISAVIFAIFDPNRSGLPPHHGAAHGALVNGTVADAGEVPPMMTRTSLSHRQENSGSYSNSVVYLFRLGGVAAIVAWILCWRLARELKRRGL
jgi:solute carrier family 45 protein 1/2/4